MKTTYRKIWRIFTSDQKRKVALLLFAMVFGAVLETISLGLVLPLLGTIFQPDAVKEYSFIQPFLRQFKTVGSFQIVLALAALLAVLFSLKNFYLSWLIYFQSTFVFELRKQISNDIYRKYLTQPYAFFVKRNTSNFIHIIQTETTQFANVVIAPLLMLATEILVFICVFIFVVSVVSWNSLSAIIIPTLASVFFYTLLKRRLRIWGEKRYFHETMRVKNIQHGFGGIKDIKVMGRERDFLNEFDFHNHQSARYLVRSNVASQLPRLLIETFGVIAVLFLVYQFKLLDKSLDELALSLGFFGVALIRLAPSASRILSALNKMRYGDVTVNKIFDAINVSDAMNSTVVINKESVSKLSFEENLKINNISFSYSAGQRPVFVDLSLQINVGSSVGVVGKSGEGKSTLVNILLGLLQPQTGTILADGDDIFSNLRDWQNRIGYVSQQVYLSDDTLRRNIAFGVVPSEIDEQRILSVVKMAKLEEVVSGLDAGLDTEVGERGIRLSGGQQQRIGLARALYHKPSFMILDEATSGLDLKTENAVLRVISALHGSVTTLIISHRMNTLKNCDVIFEISEGRVSKLKNCDEYGELK
ncbi:MAG: hypothetical protein CMC82_02820 [Flavobacteriaceae bacterium]|nr:hypothetical protein [Flavobacteriaceae bacterium]